MAKDLWFKCDPIAFTNGLEQLDTADQAVVYIAVCFRIYAVGGPVPNKPLSFRPATHLTAGRVATAIAQLIEMGKLFLVDGELMNPRASELLAERAALSETRAKAGKVGGKRNKTVTKNHETEKNLTVSSQFPSENDAQTRGNPSIGEANAFLREEGLREERTPPPPNERPRQIPDKPDFDKPIDPAERGLVLASISSKATVERNGAEVDIPALTAWIMGEAKMAVPPHDLPLVTGWVRMGADPDRIIKPVVARLAANARGSVRGMRYFDNEIRTIFDTEKAAERANIAHFRAIERRHSA